MSALELETLTEPAAAEVERDRLRVLVTGGTGFVGTHTVARLVREGYAVRCLVRPTSDRRRLPPEVEQATGHLLDYDSLVRAARGCWAVIHLGGLVKARDVQEFRRVNRDGTANLVRAAKESGVARMVLCSSQAAAGPSTPDRRRRAEDPPQPVTDYGRSKLAAEEVLKASAGELWWCILRPPAVYGPWDTAFLTMVRWIKRGFKIRLGRGDMPFSLIHAADLAQALTLAVQAEWHSGAVWFVTDGEDHNLEELAVFIEDALGKRARWLTVPLWAGPLVAGATELYARLRGGTAFLGRQKLRELVQPAWTCDDQPFRLATGFEPSYRLREGIAETVEWYLDAGWV